jgi:hypothetical protein
MAETPALVGNDSRDDEGFDEPAATPMGRPSGTAAGGAVVSEGVVVSELGATVPSCLMTLGGQGRVAMDVYLSSPLKGGKFLRSEDGKLGTRITN